MKRIAWLLLLVLLPNTDALGDRQEPLRESFSHTVELTGRPAVHLSNAVGNITVETWGRREVRVEGEKAAWAEDPEAAREALSEVRVEILEEPEGIRIEAQPPWWRQGFWGWLLGDDVNLEVSYHLTVPREVELTVRTVDGSIEAKDVGGPTRLSSINGEVRVERGRGSLEASVTNGRIEVGLAELGHRERLFLRTVNGEIELYLPTGLGADLEVSSANGSVKTDLPVQGRRDRSSILGTLNGGGPLIRLQAQNGAIRILENRP
jgi:hypothetical protein